MSKTSLQPSRRKFMRGCVSGAALLSTGLIAPNVAANGNSLLNSRKDATPLLLNYNENSFGMSLNGITAALNATKFAGNRYPDTAVEALRSLLADLHGVSSEQVIFGNGSTEVIQAVVTMAEGNNATVIEPSPTFGDVKRYSNAEQLKIVKVPVGKEFQTDIAALREKTETVSGTLLINICNPNNPTGTIVDQTALTDWIKEAPAHHIFLIDEAYFDYAQLDPLYSSVLPLIKSGKENLILTRTFSKIYGMAGMRVGYGIAAHKTAIEVRKFAAGYNLSATGTAAALASLADHEFYQNSIQSNLTAKQELLSTLDELKLKHIKSHTNFVLHRINNTVENYAARMKANGILVGRRMTKEDGWNRISIGTPKEMTEFTNVLRQFRTRGWV